jgi:amino acid adenylation domain-containing protein
VTGTLPAPHQLFREHAQRAPDAVAVAWPGRTVTYAELDAMSCRLAAAVRGHPVVALCAGRCIGLLAAVLGVLRSGGAYVPLDPTYPRGRLDFMLGDSGASLLLHDDVSAAALGSPTVRRLRLDTVLEAGLDGYADEDPRPDSTAYIIYTSGSTGWPKGVDMPHGPLANLLEWQASASLAGPAWNTLQFTSMSFDVAFQELFATWGTGGTVVLVDEATRRDPFRLLQYLDQESVHRVFMPFVALQRLADAACTLAQYPRTLREVITAGEQLFVTSALRRFFAMTGAALHNQYGPTETHAATAHHLIGPPAQWPERPSIGTPVRGVTIHIVDEDGCPVAPGHPGEIRISGPTLATGYWRRPDLTSERFVTGPDGLRQYRTGDIGRLGPGGDYDFLGRQDGQVKIRGYRVELGEVEMQVKRLPGVRDGVVVAHQPAEGHPRLVAYYVASGAVPAPSTLRQLLAEVLPDHQVPWACVRLPELPVNPNGKVDRDRLARMRVEPVAEPTRVGPRDAVELQLCDLWQSVLDVPQVSVTDDYFELGGDSLYALRVVAETNAMFGTHLTTEDLLGASTIATLATLVRSTGQRRDDGPLVRIQAGNSGAPLYVFHAVSGTVLRYVPLSRALGPAQTVWGAQSPALTAVDARVDSIEDLAVHHIRHMRSSHGAEPWHLAGYSMGGLIAFEVARRLRAAGDQVGVVCLLDAMLAGGGRDWRSEAMEVFVRSGLRIDVDLGWLTSLAFDEQLEYLLHQGIAAQTLPADYDTGRLNRMLNAYVDNGTAFNAYQPQDYPGRVVLFRASDRSADEYATDEMLGWHRYAAEVRVHEVPGNHYQIMQPAHVSGVAEVLRRYLDEYSTEEGR